MMGEHSEDDNKWASEDERSAAANDEAETNCSELGEAPVEANQSEVDYLEDPPISISPDEALSGSAEESDEDLIDLVKHLNVRIPKFDAARSTLVLSRVNDFFLGDESMESRPCIVCLATRGPTVCMKTCGIDKGSKHVKAAHKELLQSDGSMCVTIKNIKGMIGVKIFYKPHVSFKTTNNFGIASQPKLQQRTASLKQQYESACVDFLLDNGLSFEALNTDVFEKMMNLRAKLAVTDRVTIPRDVAKARILAFFKSYTDRIPNNLRETEAYFVSHDFWDAGSRHHIFAASIHFTTYIDNRLKAESAPILFRELDGIKHMDLETWLKLVDYDDPLPSEDFSTVSAATEIADIFSSHATRLGFPKNIAACTGNGSPSVRATGRAILQKSGIDLFEDSGVLEGTEEKCLGYDMGLILNYALGTSKSTSRNSNIPPSPSPEVLQLIASCRALATIVSQSEAWKECKEIARDWGIPLTKVNGDLEVRWLSTFNTMVEIADNATVLKRYCQRHSTESTKISDISKIVFGGLSLLLDLITVIKPLKELSVVLETRKPLAMWTLPAIAVLLWTYGADLKTESGILKRDSGGVLSWPDHSDGRIRFERYRPKNLPLKESLKKLKSSKIVSSSMLQPMARAFLQTLQEHMEYRLFANRQNANGLELVATFCHPNTQPFLPFVCGKSFWEVRGQIIEWLKKRHMPVQGPKPGPADSNREGSPGPNLQATETAFDDPLMRRVSSAASHHGLTHSFNKEVQDFEEWAETTSFGIAVGEHVGGVVGLALNLENLIKEIKSVDSCSLWHSGTVQKYPTFFAVNRVTLAKPSTSLFMESLFSSVDHTFENRRRWLRGNPATLEAVVLSRFIRSEERRESKERAKLKGSSDDGRTRQFPLNEATLNTTEVAKEGTNSDSNAINASATLQPRQVKRAKSTDAVDVEILD